MDHSEKAAHAHPFMIFTYLYRFLFLMVIPLLRGFLSALRGGLIAWLAGAWFDILVLGVIVALAYAKWSNFKYYMDSTGIYFTSGIFIRHQAFIPARRISTLSVLTPFWLRPFGVSRVRVDTVARNPKKADLNFITRSAEARRMMYLRREPLLERDGTRCEYRPRVRDIALLSLFTSNSLIGILFLATFIKQAGQILGQELADMLITTFEAIARRVAFGLPPVAAGAALLLLTGWLFAFLLGLLQTKNLRVRRTEHALWVSGGVLVRKSYSLRGEDLCFVDVRQSLMTRLVGLYSVFLNGIGFGKDDADLAAVVPFSTKRRAIKHLSLLLPEFVPAERTLKPNPGAVFKFLIDPIWPCVLVPAGTALAARLLPGWLTIIRFAGFMLSLPAFWFLGVRLLDFLSSGVSRKGEYFTLRYSERYYLHTVVVPYEKISLVNVRQSILQRGDDKCDLVVSTRAEGRWGRRHHLRNLDRAPVLALFQAGDTD